MRALLPLILLLVVAVVVLAWYALRLRRQIRESDNPRLALSRRDLRDIARKEEARRAASADLDIQERAGNIVSSFGTPTLNPKD